MLTVNGRMAVSTGVIDGYIISNWTEEALADMLDQTTLKDNPLGFTDLTPIGSSSGIRRSTRGVHCW